MKLLLKLIPYAVVSLVALAAPEALGQNIPVAHWINRAGSNAATVLNNNGVFITDFKGSNDLKVTPLNTHTVSLYTCVYGGSTPGNNPWYTVEFTGASSNGTGDGVLGDLTDLNMTTDATSTLQFDFALALGPQDRVLMVDVDGSEQYQLQAYVLTNGNYVPVSVAGWTVQNFTGTTSQFPTSSWPKWNPATAILSGNGSLNEELVTFTPDQKIDRLVVSKLAASSQSSEITFVSLSLPLTIRPAVSNVVLTWANIPAQNYPVAHWINDLGQDAGTVLNSGGTFLTDFKSHNDLRAVFLTADPLTLSPSPGSSSDSFGGSTPGNNPPYLTNFVGVPYNGTGNGVLGLLESPTLTSDETGSIQFDFLTPLSPQDRVLIIDIDGPEQYLFKAFKLSGTNYSQVSFAGWNTQNFSGMTGTQPGAQWPIWDGTNGTAIAGASVNLNEELFVLTPDQNIDRLQIIKQAGPSWSINVNFESPSALTTPAVFTLQSSTNITGPYTNIVGALSPYTNALSGSARFFRLMGN